MYHQHIACKCYVLLLAQVTTLLVGEKLFGVM